MAVVGAAIRADGSFWTWFCCGLSLSKVVTVLLFIRVRVRSDVSYSSMDSNYTVLACTAAGVAVGAAAAYFLAPAKRANRNAAFECVTGS